MARIPAHYLYRNRLRRRFRPFAAFLRDTRALWGEFRRPILVFFAATFVGGWLYGELYELARGEQIEFFNLPYIMIQLMALQGIPDEPLPHELYLSVFWYLMPAIGFYVVGRGLVDFFRVFFDRGARQRSWEAALAAEYREHIIVVGAGHVGLRVIRSLREMGFDVIAIDKETSVERVEELRRLQTPFILGDATVAEILHEAGIQYADAITICTADDYVNITLAMRARDLNADIRIIVRMWDSRFAEQLKRFVNVEGVLSASELAAPAFAGAAFGVQIAQTLHIRDEAYSVIRLTVAPRSFMVGATIDRLQEDNNFDIVLIERDSQTTLHPPGDIVIRSGDTLVIFARHEQIIGIVEANRRNGR